LEYGVAEDGEFVVAGGCGGSAYDTNTKKDGACGHSAYRVLFLWKHLGLM
jgi:hypothetical protein